MTFMSTDITTQNLWVFAHSTFDDLLGGRGGGGRGGWKKGGEGDIQHAKMGNINVILRHFIRND